MQTLHSVAYRNATQTLNNDCAMSLYDYRESKDIALHSFGFYALLMELMRRADSTNIAKLRTVWPDVYDELYARYNAPGGILPSDTLPEDDDTLRDDVNGVNTASGDDDDDLPF